MAREKDDEKVRDQQEPEGFTPGTQGETGKAAREEGWGLGRGRTHEAAARPAS
jgi:hypothetical protein